MDTPQSVFWIGYGYRIPMLRYHHSASVGAAKNYFNNSLTRGDYYLEGQEIAGCWRGRGADMLDLKGEVQKDDFFSLLENRRIDGSKLTASDGKDRRPGYDFTFDVPKSVSVLHAHSQDERIVEAMRQAVFDTMQEMERDMHTRVRKNGADHDRVTGNMIYADFTHFTTRPAEKSKQLADNMPDPQLHMHLYVMNATFDPVENEWKAGQFGQITRDMPYYQACYHARLATELQKLGLEIIPTKDAFEIVGVPDTLKEKFSRRTKEIDRVAKELGITSAKEKDGLNEKLRRTKNLDLDMLDIRGAWHQALDTSEVDQLISVMDEASTQETDTPVENHNAVKDVLDHVIAAQFERDSDVSEKRLIAEVMRHGIGQAHVETIKEMIRDDDRLLIGTIHDERRVTTKDILKEEADLIKLVRDGRGSMPSLVPKGYEFQEALFRDPTKDTNEQKAAVLHVLHSNDWAVGVVGRAGTGKTTLMQEVNAGLGKNGRDMIVCAPTAEASRGVLRKEGFKDANTIAHLLHNEKLQERLRGNVLWIDEAGMVGSVNMAKLMKLAKSKGAAKVVLSGDPTQIRSVPRGDAFKFLEERAGLSVARLRTIQRQRCDDLKEAVQYISDGQMIEGFDKLDEIGSVIEMEDDDRYQALAKDYADTSDQRVRLRKKSVLVISPTHKESAEVTDAIREELKSRNKLKGKEREFTRLVDAGWKEADRQRAVNYEPGMIVKFRQNTSMFKKSQEVRVMNTNTKTNEVGVLVPGTRDCIVRLKLEDAKHFGVYRQQSLKLAKGDRIRMTGCGYAKDGKYRFDNGDFKEIAGFTKSGDIKLKNGKIISKNYGHLNHGYCITADSSQAKTVDVTLYAMGSDSLGAIDSRRTYVGLSRSRYEARIYTDNKKQLRHAIQRNEPRRSGHEVIEQVQEDHVKRIAHQTIREHTSQRNQIAKRSFRQQRPLRGPPSRAIPNFTRPLSKQIGDRMRPPRKRNLLKEKPGWQPSFTRPLSRQIADRLRQKGRERGR